MKQGINLDRRALLRLAALGLPALLVKPRRPLAEPHPAAMAERTLLLIELVGGNDGLNTLIPFEDAAYYKLRPKLALKRDKTLPFSQGLGLHPALEPLLAPWREREVAAILGVGYPHPNRSHFRSIEIWDTASDASQYLSEGWISRLLGNTPLPKGLPFHALGLGGGSNGLFEGEGLKHAMLDRKGEPPRLDERPLQAPEHVSNKALAHILEVRKDLRKTAEALIDDRVRFARPAATFGKGRLGTALEAAARLMLAGIRPPVIKVAHSTYDTHAHQLPQHEALLGELAAGVFAFRQAMSKAGLWDKTLIMTYSEFGRRAGENASLGTDHGTAAPHFLIGGKVKGGLYGEAPSLADLKDGDLVHTADFRSLYSTVAEGWWEVPGLPGFKPIGCL
jgi:uncharacterized protein (DUF1501 family)